MSAIETKYESAFSGQADLPGSSAPFQTQHEVCVGWTHRKHIGGVLVSKPSRQAMKIQHTGHVFLHIERLITPYSILHTEHGVRSTS